MQPTVSFNRSFQFGAGRISWERRWFKVHAALETIEFVDNNTVILTSRSSELQPDDTIPISCDIIELCDHVGTMEFGSTRVRILQGDGSVCFEIVPGTFSHYNVCSEPQLNPMHTLQRRVQDSHNTLSVHSMILRSDANINREELEEKYDPAPYLTAAEHGEIRGQRLSQTGLPVPNVVGDIQPQAFTAPNPVSGILARPVTASPLPQPVPQAIQLPMIPREVSSYEVEPMIQATSPHAFEMVRVTHSSDPLDYMSDSTTLLTASDDQCVICRSSYEIGEVKRWLPCAHGFHAHCIDRWVTMPRSAGAREFAECPTCKVPLDVLASRATYESDMTSASNALRSF